MDSSATHYSERYIIWQNTLLNDVCVRSRPLEAMFLFSHIPHSKDLEGGYSVVFPVRLKTVAGNWTVGHVHPWMVGFEIISWPHGHSNSQQLDQLGT